jgi:hypothetical protein
VLSDEDCVHTDSSIISSTFEEATKKMLRDHPKVREHLGDQSRDHYSRTLFTKTRDSLGLMNMFHELWQNLREKCQLKERCLAIIYNSVHELKQIVHVHAHEQCSPKTY